MTINFIQYNNSTQEIIRTGTAHEDIYNIIKEEYPTIEGLGSYATHYVSGGTLVEYTEQQKLDKATRPRFPAIWSNETMFWVDQRSLEQKRNAKWEEIKQARQLEDESPLSTPYGLFDADYSSQQKIAGAVQLAILAPDGWEVDWTLHDNSVVTLTKEHMVNIGILLGARTSSLYQQARGLREQISNATEEELAIITWGT